MQGNRKQLVANSNVSLIEVVFYMGFYIVSQSLLVICIIAQLFGDIKMTRVFLFVMASLSLRFVIHGIDKKSERIRNNRLSVNYLAMSVQSKLSEVKSFVLSKDINIKENQFLYRQLCLDVIYYWEQLDALNLRYGNYTETELSKIQKELSNFRTQINQYMPYVKNNLVKFNDKEEVAVKVYTFQ